VANNEDSSKKQAESFDICNFIRGLSLTSGPWKILAKPVYQFTTESGESSIC
jgi:hypothetical protein